MKEKFTHERKYEKVQYRRIDIIYLLLSSFGIGVGVGGLFMFFLQLIT